MRVGIFSVMGAVTGGHPSAETHMWVGELPVPMYDYPLAACSLCQARGQWDEGICVESGHQESTGEQICERIFRLLNRVDEGDHERMAALGYVLPSLSVGDFVSFGGTTYRCDSVGFTLLTGTEQGQALVMRSYSA